jgi:hypothetical protein
MKKFKKMNTFKSSEDFQRELYDLFSKAGEHQFRCRKLRQDLEEGNSLLNKTNQQLETVVKAYKDFLQKQNADQPAEPEQEATADEAQETGIVAQEQADDQAI